jgi:nitrite reductase/ring-hydroxylating ferredoxin subunit
MQNLTMKKALFTFCISLLLVACSKSDNIDKTCNYLLNVGVDLRVNLNFPKYSELQFISNAVYDETQGNKGIIIMNTGTGYAAWDASDPNHAPNTCSTLQISGAEAICNCEDNKYSLFTGQPLENETLRCGLKPYRVEVNGNELFISN